MQMHDLLFVLLEGRRCGSHVPYGPIVNTKPSRVDASIIVDAVYNPENTVSYSVSFARRFEHRSRAEESLRNL